MSLSPILTAPLELQLHVCAALLALVAGPFALYRRRRDRLHRVLGYGWVIAMALTALSGLVLPAQILPLAFGFGPVHALCLAVLAGLWNGVRSIRSGQIARHRHQMRALYWQGLGIAGLLTLIPGRTMNQVLFPGAPGFGWPVMALGGAALALLFWRNARPFRVTTA